MGRVGRRRNYGPALADGGEVGWCERIESRAWPGWHKKRACRALRRSYEGWSGGKMIVRRFRQGTQREEPTCFLNPCPSVLLAFAKPLSPSAKPLRRSRDGGARSVGRLFAVGRAVDAAENAGGQECRASSTAVWRVHSYEWRLHSYEWAHGSYKWSPATYARVAASYERAASSYVNAAASDERGASSYVNAAASYVGTPPTRANVAYTYEPTAER